MQNKIILFCYAYLAGIVLAMVAPVDPVHTPLLHLLTALALLLLAGLMTHRWFRRPTPEVTAPPAGVSGWTLLVLAAAFLGYSRYLDANTVPDTRLGTVWLSPEGATLKKESDIPDTCRLRIRKTQSLDGDVRLRLRGELEARLPVLSGDGLPTLDTEGRWRFRVVKTPQESDVVILAKDDPVGTDYVVAQPFTHLTGIERLEGASSGRVELYRISNHISSFVRPGRNQAPVTLLGRISADPLVYDFKTVLPVTPDFIQYRKNGPFYHVNGGDVRVTLQPTLTGYDAFARSEAFGYDVVVEGELSGARPQANPGGFDARRFLQNHNIYGHLSAFQPRGLPPPIHAVAPESRALREGHGLVEFSLSLRDDMLRVFKQTVPYPQSAFLGAVALGLRYGLQGAAYSAGGLRGGSGADLTGARTPMAPPSEDFIVDEFRAAGVNHVLAVSGLHVTIITAMFMGIFTLLRMPRKVYVPVVIFTLIIFAIITGARPSTLRAVIMNSLLLLTWGYLGQGLQASALFGVPVAAFLILLHNPLMIVDPSFTLSFGAILSLALLTGPFHELLSRLKGNNLLYFFLVAGLTTGIGMWKWPLLVRPVFWIPYAAACGLLLLLFRKLEQKQVHLAGNLSYAHIPAAAGVFLAAQCGIQIGMMIPLSSFYFARWPFAGVYANLVAIPLIGVVVQLGVMAGLLAFLPLVGPYIALVLGAANWVFSSFFLWIAHASANLFPYPFLRKPSLRFLVVYYLFCAGFIWHKPLWGWARTRCRRLGFRGRAAPACAALVAAFFATAPLWAARSPRKPDGLNITVLSVGYGSSVLVESPGGRRVLIDGGFVEHERGRRNEMVRTILPFLSYEGIRRLDAAALLSPLPERAAGLSDLLQHCWVKTLYLPEPLTGLTPNTPYETFADNLTAGEISSSYPPEVLEGMYEELVQNPLWPKRPSLAKALAARQGTLFNRWAGWDVRVRPLRKGTVLLEEQHGDRSLRIEALHPDSWTPAEHPVENQSAVIRIAYGRFAMLLTGDLHYAGQAYLADSYPAERLRADVVVAPHRGTAIPAGDSAGIKPATLTALRKDTRRLLDKVKPAYAVFEFGNPRPVLGRFSRDALHVYENTYRYFSDRLGADACLVTDRDMAVFIHSDGYGYKVETQAGRLRSAGTVEEAVSDLEIGF